jgi:hypothetical protein
MKKGINLGSFFKPIGRVIGRYHLTLFILLVVGCLTAAVLLLTNILDEASQIDDYQSPITAGSLDQATLDRINALHTSSDTLPEPIPATGRISPFTE